MRVTVQHTVKELLNLFGPNGEHWTQGAFARNENGRIVGPDTPNACKWCLSGGIMHLTQKNNVAYYSESLSTKFEKLTGYDSLSNFNDNHTWPEVKNLLEEMAHTIHHLEGI